ncbi:uncharacterized protein LOC116345801 [Contarinia nasturtii]|uniref:uncharacterized protein LOC116345801 n=1 Tax=Contarinia nasturtii TaxID=265458 RepID=UPI0012D3AA83|nr:uncharacterized protein LOC116345801 [Contarinia nasturtii]
MNNQVNSSNPIPSTSTASTSRAARNNTSSNVFQLEDMSSVFDIDAPPTPDITFDQNVPVEDDAPPTPDMIFFDQDATVVANDAPPNNTLNAAASSNNTTDNKEDDDDDKYIRFLQSQVKDTRFVSDTKVAFYKIAGTCLLLTNIEKESRFLSSEPNESNIKINQLISDHQNLEPSLQINPDLVYYANQNHDYSELSTADRIFLSSLRLEVERIKLGIEKDNLIKADDVATKKCAEKRKRFTEMCCVLCSGTVTPHMKTAAYKCGHIFCLPCIDTLEKKTVKCPMCRKVLVTNDKLELCFRFNYWYKPICRRCLKPFEDDDDVQALVCGDVFCATCTFHSGNYCQKCDSFAKPLKLFLSFE